MPVFRSFFRVIAIPLALVLPQVGWGEEVGRCVLPDELQMQLSEVLGDAGDASEACPDLWGDEENMQALGKAAMAMATARRNRILAPIIDSSLELGKSILAELAHPRIRERAELPEEVSEAFQAAWAMEEEHRNIEAVIAFKELLDDAPDDADLQAAFLRNCYLAGDNCPPLWPEQRSRIPEWSCTEAVNLAVEHFSEALGVAAERARANSDLPESEKQNQAMAQDFVGNGISFSFEMTDWVIPASYHTSALILLMERYVREDVALAIAVNDRVMRCNQDRDIAVLIRHGFGAPGQTYDDLMRPVMRDNLLDVAWRVLDYQLPQEGGADEDQGQDE